MYKIIVSFWTADNFIDKTWLFNFLFCFLKYISVKCLFLTTLTIPMQFKTYIQTKSARKEGISSARLHQREEGDSWKNFIYYVLHRKLILIVGFTKIYHTILLITNNMVTMPVCGLICITAHITTVAICVLNLFLIFIR